MAVGHIAGKAHRDCIRADRWLPGDMQRLGDRAPPARRIASFARSYVCFGPIMPGGLARERFGACLNIVPDKQGGRAHLAHGLLARNKRRSERSSRCAARAALDLTGAEDPAPTPARDRALAGARQSEASTAAIRFPALAFSSLIATNFEVGVYVPSP